MSDRIVGWKAIASELGISVYAAKHVFYRAGLRLAKLRPSSRNSDVWITRKALGAIRDQLVRATSD